MLQHRYCYINYPKSQDWARPDFPCEDSCAVQFFTDAHNSPGSAYRFLEYYLIVDSGWAQTYQGGLDQRPALQERQQTRPGPPPGGAPGKPRPWRRRQPAPRRPLLLLLLPPTGQPLPRPAPRPPS